MRPDESRAFFIFQTWGIARRVVHGRAPQAGESLAEKQVSRAGRPQVATGSLVSPARQSPEVPGGHGAQSSCKRGSYSKRLLKKS